MSGLLLMRELICERTGIHFSDDSMFSLQSSIKKRMETVECVSITQYHSMILSDNEEMNRLINLITVNETYFLREPAQFRVLTETVFPEILRRKPPDKKVRFLSAGCSTGEEPFSIAMSLVEKYGASILDRVEVFGVDIDNNVVNTARAGVYRGHSFRGVDPKIRQRYFFPKAGAGQEAYEISDLLKKAVNFQVLNLFDTQYPVQLNSMDVIFYRNVSIYFSASAKKEIFGNLSKLLAPGGYIFLSSSETYFHNMGILHLHEMENAFVYQRRIEIPSENIRIQPAAARDTHPMRLTPPLSERAKAPSDLKDGLYGSVQPMPSDSHALFDEALALAVNKEYQPALLALESLIEKDRGFKKAFSLKASILLNTQNIVQAEESVRTLLAIDEWDVEGLLLLGIIEKTKELREEAIRQFKKAIYIKQQSWLAHFYLAELYYGLDDLKGATYEYGVAASILEKDSGLGHGLTYFPLSSPTDQLAKLCRHNIGKIARGLQKNVGA